MSFACGLLPDVSNRVDSAWTARFVSPADRPIGSRSETHALERLCETLVWNGKARHHKRPLNGQSSPYPRHGTGARAVGISARFWGITEKNSTSPTGRSCPFLHPCLSDQRQPYPGGVGGAGAM